MLFIFWSGTAKVLGMNKVRYADLNLASHSTGLCLPPVSKDYQYSVFETVNLLVMFRVSSGTQLVAAKWVTWLWTQLVTAKWVTWLWKTTLNHSFLLAFIIVLSEPITWSIDFQSIWGIISINTNHVSYKPFSSLSPKSR